MPLGWKAAINIWQLSSCQILIAEETLLHLAGKFEVESWGALPLKDREQKVNVYGILGMKKK
ncbi:hypothetical protein QUA00_25865 [Microcoleus sp. T2B6]|uniref:hypothetical protein n=1 Tax=Microcoleus sp. T2B6 TaxID=3055424 RepID=UPI002FD404CD